MNNKLIHKVYFLLCILEEFGFIASASCSTELTDFKITETVQRPNFCSFCGTLEEALQLAASPDLAAAHVQMRADGRGECAVPCRADGDQLLVLPAVWAELTPQASTSCRSFLKAAHRRRVCGFHCFGELCPCLPGLHSASVCDLPWSWQFCTHATNRSSIRNYSSSPGENKYPNLLQPPRESRDL